MASFRSLTDFLQLVKDLDERARVHELLITGNLKVDRRESRVIKQKYHDARAALDKAIKDLY